MDCCQPVNSILMETNCINNRVAKTKLAKWIADGCNLTWSNGEEAAACVGMDAKLFASKPEFIEAAWSSVVEVVVMGTKAREPIGSDPNKSISRLLTADAAGVGTDADGAPTGAADKKNTHAVSIIMRCLNKLINFPTMLLVLGSKIFTKTIWYENEVLFNVQYLQAGLCTENLLCNKGTSVIYTKWFRPMGCSLKVIDRLETKFS